MEAGTELGEIQLETPDQRAIRKWGGYRGYKAEMDHVVGNTTEDMLKIGYMLKQARDTSILEGSGYAGVWDFAQAEYGIGKTQASRFMAAADRYADADPEPEETETDPRNTAIAEGSYLDMMKASGHIMEEVMDENVDWSTAWNDVRDFQVKVEKFVDSLTALQCRDLRARSDKKERSKSTDENCNRNM